MKHSTGKASWQRPAILLRMIAHPRHRSIIDAVADGEQTVGHIVTTTELPQALTSQHLKILRDHGVLASRRDANRVYYRISDPSVLKVLRDLRRNGLIG